MATVFDEYRSQNQNRKYPFLDDMSLLAVDGAQMPIDFLIDAFLYPIDATGPIYLSSIDFGKRTMTFTDAGTRNVCGTVQWAVGADSAPVLDLSGYEREIGMVILNPEASRAISTVMEFEAGNTTLVPTCAVPLRQQAVRGLVSTTDGGFFTGHVKITGRNGVRVHSYIRESDGKHIVRIDIVGTLPPPAEECEVRTIKRIHIINAYCTPIVASEGAGAVINVVGSPGFDLEDRCTTSLLPSTGGELPAQRDPCNPRPPPTPYECVDPSEFTIELSNGEVFIVSPSLLEGGNVVQITTEESEVRGLGVAPTLGQPPGDVVTQMNYELRGNAVGAGRITISLRGPASESQGS